MGVEESTPQHLAAAMQFHHPAANVAACRNEVIADCLHVVHQEWDDADAVQSLRSRILIRLDVSVGTATTLGAVTRAAVLVQCATVVRNIFDHPTDVERLVDEIEDALHALQTEEAE